MKNNHNIIASFSHPTPWNLSNPELIASTFLSDINLFNSLFVHSGGELKPKETDKRLNELNTGIYFRIIIVRDVPGEEVNIKDLKETKLKNLRVTYLNYSTFFSRVYNHQYFNNLVGYTEHQQIIVIFYNTNWDYIITCFKALGKTVVGAESAYPNGTHFLNRNQYRLSIFLFCFFGYSPESWVTDSYSKGTSTDKLDLPEIDQK
jgi:hypothetical protein